MSKWIKGSLTSILGAGVASMFFCLPCWIPLLMFLNSMGMAGILAPEWAPLIKALPLILTVGVVWRLGEKKQATWALAAAVAAWAAPGYWAVPGFVALGWLLWTARKTSCKI